MELAKRMIRMRGLRPHIDIPIRIIGARPGEKLHEELKSEDEMELPTLHPAIVQLIKSQDSESSQQPLTDDLKTILKNGLHQADDMEWIVKMSWILYQSYRNDKISLSV
jgi:FlaA1/EpsC-like NDP-sugar epimerase